MTPVESVPVKCITVDSGDGLFLATRSFVLTHNSSLGRLGLVVHATAGWGDPGFDGQYTLEVAVLGEPVIVYVGMRIGQIRFESLCGEIAPYNGNYRGPSATGAVPSRSWKQFDR